MSGSNIPPIKRAEIIIPIYYHRPELFLIIDKCLKTLDLYYPKLKRIIIDDGSPLPTDMWPITYRNKENLGFTKTINIGLALSKKPVIIIANDDIEFHPGCLDRFFELKDLGIYSPRDSASGGLKSFGAIWGMTRKTFRKLGYLDERFKHFYSDVDYLERAERLKVPVVKWDDILITHHESATYNLLPKELLMADDYKKFRRNE
jgi:GT2 family glycosyltransferase